MAETDKTFALKLTTPEGTFGPFACDSVKLHITDGKNGTGSGAYGIRRGHAPALLALMAGQITASSNGKTVASAQIGEGFAMVHANLVTVTVDTLTDLKTEKS